MRFLSLFSGIEAASCAWFPLGWECVAVAEIEKFPSAVLAVHYPEVPNLGDITKITEKQIKSLGHIDLVVGGFPCQDLSVAGKRKGLKNEDGTNTRSGLFFDAMRIVRWSNARYLLIENVPGLYSSNDGRDFAAVVGEILGVEFDIPRNGWKNTGVAASQAGLLEWATLDAQWFGVPQRRRRFFAFADFGDWTSRPPVLFERHSMSGNPAPSREARQNVAGTLGSRSTAGGGLGTDFDLAGGVQPVAFGGNNTTSSIDVATARNACASASASGQMDFESETFIVAPPLTSNPYGDHESREGLLVTHALRGEGFDASEDGTGRGTPIVPVAIAFDTTQITSPENRSNPKAGDPCHPLAAAAHAPAIAFQTRGSNLDTNGVISGTLGTGSGSASGSAPCIAFNLRGRDGGAQCEVDPSGMQVRRLTPMECERLQGFPDHWTDIPVKGKSAPDGPRYKALGNSMAVPVMSWIGRRIQMMEDIMAQISKKDTA